MSNITESSDRHPGAAIALGRQLTVEYYDCNAGIINDADQMRRIFVAAAAAAGATVISADFHRFDPQGVSGVVVISESHFAVHAWPEYAYAAVDIFTCGDRIDFEAAVDAIKRGISSCNYQISSLMNRGILGPCGGVERIRPIPEAENMPIFQCSWENRFKQTGGRAFSDLIDLYGCAEHSDAEWPKVLSELTRRLAVAVGAKSPGEFSFEDGDFSRHAPGVAISGFVAADANCVYLDISSRHFFDPRRASELALTFLNSKYYRMQPCVRQ